MLNYRPDIDGLRAIAVCSVVLYHLQETLLPGGFVGVDVFFVISGYLITKLIHSELVQTQQFSFKRFYMRRVRRLFPALLATLIFSFVLAYVYFSPAHLIEFGKSAIAAILSVSNLFFWSITGYFDTDSSIKPLLHTWSLSVEEQFYFIWPALLVWLFSLSKKKLIPRIIVLAGVASLLLNIIVFSGHPTIEQWLNSGDGQQVISVQSTAFYWLPFRVFEFSIGAILVWLTTPSKRLIAECSFVVGLGMVLASFWLLDSATNFPSTAALLPCIGAALMIYSGTNHRFSWLVSNRITVGIGLISYSLYLVHWPLIVFYKYAIGREFTALEMSGIAVVSLTLAGLMYWFIEQPFRKPVAQSATQTKSPNRRFLLGSAFAALATITVSANAVSSQGWLWRYPADRIAQLSYQQGDYSDFFWANMKRLESQFMDNSKPKVLVIGDSMAADLVNVLVAGDAESELDIATIMVNHHCKSLFGFTEAQYRQIYQGGATRCMQEHDRILAKQDLLLNADTIVLASHWWEHFQAEQLPSTVEHLKTLSDAKIMVLGLKTQRHNGIWFLNKHAFSRQAHLLRTKPHPQAQQVNAIMRKQAKGYLYFDLLRAFCEREGCQRITKDGYAIVFDQDHLSENGAKLLASKNRNSRWYQQMLVRKEDRSS